MIHMGYADWPTTHLPAFIAYFITSCRTVPPIALPLAIGAARGSLEARWVGSDAWFRIRVAALLDTRTEVLNRDPGGIGEAGVGVGLAIATAHGVELSRADLRHGCTDFECSRIVT